MNIKVNDMWQQTHKFHVSKFDKQIKDNQIIQTGIAVNIGISKECAVMFFNTEGL